MSSPPFARYAWFVLVFNVFTIVWGAYVRASGSGAGCGAHWPLCNGEVLPRAQQVQTLVELTHRLTSGLDLLLVIGLAFWARRALPLAHPARGGALASLGFIILEALLGAGLVLFQLVVDNASVARAIVVALHLANTFMLLGVLTVTAWWASGGAPPWPAGNERSRLVIGIGLLGTLLLGMSGAVTALGDTLFPAGSIPAGVAADFADAAHFLVRLRVIHPLLAIFFGVYLVAAVALVAHWRGDQPTRRLARLAGSLYVAQLLVGALNLGLLAPIWTQLIHLALADAVWIALVMLGAQATGQRPVASDEWVVASG